MLIHSWYHSPVLHTVWEGVPLGVSVQNFVVPYFPWSLLSMWIPNIDICAWFLCLYCILSIEKHLQNSVYVSVIEFFIALIGMCCYYHDTFSPRGSSVLWEPCLHYVYLCELFSSPFTWCVFLSLCIFLAHESHPSSQPGLHLCQGCQYFLANYCHVLLHSVIWPNLCVN